MAWSIFTDGGGPAVAGTWADDLLKDIGAPLSAGNRQMIYDWEVSEGGGGAYNPLNQGPDPKNPSLTSTGPQYGGGAADYVSWQAGLQGATDYLNMPDYLPIQSDLRASNPVQARTDLYNSPWASSHYGYGANFSNSPFPGKTQALPATGGDTTATLTSANGTVPSSWFEAVLGGPAGIAAWASNKVGQAAQGGGNAAGILTKLYNLLSNPVDILERGALMLFGAILIIMGLYILTTGTRTGRAITSAATRGVSTNIQGSISGQSQDRARRLALAESANEIGARKLALKEKREARLERRSDVQRPAVGRHRKAA